MFIARDMPIGPIGNETPSHSAVKKLISVRIGLQHTGHAGSSFLGDWKRTFLKEPENV